MAYPDPNPLLASSKPFPLTSEEGSVVAQVRPRKGQLRAPIEQDAASFRRAKEGECFAYLTTALRVLPSDNLLVRNGRSRQSGQLSVDGSGPPPYQQEMSQKSPTGEQRKFLDHHNLENSSPLDFDSASAYLTKLDIQTTESFGLHLECVDNAYCTDNMALIAVGRVSKQESTRFHKGTDKPIRSSPFRRFFAKRLGGQMSGRLDQVFYACNDGSMLYGINNMQTASLKGHGHEKHA